MKPQLQQRPGDRPILRVYYDNQRRDWAERIRQALHELGLKRDDVLVIAMPYSLAGKGF